MRPVSGAILPERSAHLRARRRIAREMGYAIVSVAEGYPLHVIAAFLTLLWWAAAAGGGLNPGWPLLIAPVVIARGPGRGLPLGAGAPVKPKAQRLAIAGRPSRRPGSRPPAAKTTSRVWVF